MRIQFIIYVLFIIYSCKEGEQKQSASANDTKDSIVANSNVQAEEETEASNLAVVDTGQTWFRVVITRNDSAFMDYAGSWPVFLLSNNSATLQLSKSKNIMSVTDILTIYMNGMPTGKTAIVLSNSEKGTASMILSPVTDGAYGLPIMPTEGFLNITKNVDSVVTGNFEGKAVDANNDRYAFKGYFLNVKINPEKI